VTRPVCSRHRSTISWRPMATTAFFFKCWISASQDFLPLLDRFILGLKQDHPPNHLDNDPPNGRHSHFGNGATPLFVSRTPFAGDHPCQASDLATVFKKGPIEHLTLELHLTAGANPFRPGAAAGPSQRNFSLTTFLIEHFEKNDRNLPFSRSTRVNALCSRRSIIGKSLESRPAHPRASALAVGQTRKAGTSRSCRARLVPLGSQVPGSAPKAASRSIEWCEIGRHLPWWILVRIHSYPMLHPGYRIEAAFGRNTRALRRGLSD
jgi:hypothetical protein